MKVLNKKYLLGADIGTSQFKLTAVSEDGNDVLTISKELITKYPMPGWSEQDPEGWYNSFVELCKTILLKLNLKAEDIAAICVTGTAHTFVLLDSSDRVLRPAILWTDQRSYEEVKWLNDNYGHRLIKLAYHQANPTWTLPQLLWINKNEPEIYDKANKIMMASDYLRFRISNVWVTSCIDALGTLMMDAERREWSAEICNYINWPMTRLPKIVFPKTVAGEVSKEASFSCGLREGTPVITGASDTAIEDYGVGAVNPQQCVIKLATAGNVNVMNDRAYPSSVLFNYYHVIPGLWYTAAATNSCASAHRWLRDLIYQPERKNSLGPETFAQMDQSTQSIPIGSGGLLFHPYLLGERTPYWDPFLRASFVGLTMRHRREHLIRALYEGIAFSLRDCYESLLKEGIKMAEVRLIGGGSKSILWSRIVSDVLGLEVLKPAMDDAGFGAALLAGVGVGIFQNERDAVQKCVKIIRSDKPNKVNMDKYFSLYTLYKKTQSLLVEINHSLCKFENSQ